VKENPAKGGGRREPAATRDVQFTDGPRGGVPDAIARTLRMIMARLGAEAVDRLWIFPPKIRGRKEWGLVAASCFHPAAEGRRLLYTARYTAERTGEGPVTHTTLHEEGEAPPDRLGRVMGGVVRRSRDELGEPREVEIAGDLQRFEELIEELDPS